MSDFYKLIEIDGKGLGCIATKMIKPGTLIFSERPGVTTTGDYPESIYFKTLMSSFKNLTPNDQKEYMELHIHNRVGEEPLDTILPKDLFEEMNPYETETYSALVLKVSGIYSTNTFSDGVGLKMARVNHSCCANASCAWEDETNEQSNCYELRAIAKIEVGEEICINYQSISLFMKNLQTRQDCLLVEWGFKCACVICLDEYLNGIEANNIYSRFEMLQNEHERFGKPQNFVSFDVTKIRIAGIMEMYKMAREKKSALSYLTNILEDGLFVATAAYIYAKESKNSLMLEVLQKDAEIFAKPWAKICKIRNGYLTESMKYRRDNCKQWLDEQQSGFSDFYKIMAIDGKDLGCIATKEIEPGTLIFSEKPAVTATGDSPESIYFQTLMSSFKSLAPNEQKEYMELHNRFSEDLSWSDEEILPKDLFEEMDPDEAKTYSALAVKLSGIYYTNTFIEGVGTKIARVNHSCCANASCVWEDESDCYELRAVTTIEVGEEICFNYQSISCLMKNFQTRQDCLLDEWGFKCACATCSDEYLNDVEANEIYSRFAKLKKEHETFGEPEDFMSFDTTKIRIARIKEMYKLASEKKSALSYLTTVLEDGLFVATAAYIHAKESKNSILLEEFEKDAEFFAKPCARICKIKNGYVWEDMKQRSENCKEWLCQQQSGFHLQRFQPRYIQETEEL